MIAFSGLILTGLVLILTYFGLFPIVKIGSKKEYKNYISHVYMPKITPTFNPIKSHYLSIGNQEFGEFAFFWTILGLLTALPIFFLGMSKLAFLIPLVFLVGILLRKLPAIGRAIEYVGHGITIHTKNEKFFQTVTYADQAHIMKRASVYYKLFKNMSEAEIAQGLASYNWLAKLYMRLVANKYKKFEKRTYG